MSLWPIRILFLSLCILAGYGVSQVNPSLISTGFYGVLIGFGLGGLLVAIDEMLKGFSLRAFSAATFGLMLGSLIAYLVDTSHLFDYAREDVRWTLRLTMFLSSGYIGIILAMRSNKEDFSLIIPYVRFASQNKPENPLVLDTSAIIDGRVVDLIELRFLEGLIVVPRFVLKELQHLADSADPVIRARGRRGLDKLNQIQRNTRIEVKIHEAEFPEEPEVDSKLLHLTKAVSGKLVTTDFNLTKVADIQHVPHVNVAQLSAIMKPAVLPGDILNLKITREGREKNQGVGYHNDGTMVVVNGAGPLVGQQVPVRIIGVHQTGAGVIIFAEPSAPIAPRPAGADAAPESTPVPPNPPAVA